MSTFDRLIEESKEKPLLVIVGAQWAPSTEMQTTRDAVHDACWARGSRVQLTTIDLDEEEALAKRLNLNQVPSVLLFRWGQLQARLSGAVTVSRLDALLGATIDAVE